MTRIALLLIAAALVAPAVSAQACGPIANHVVINEVSYDDSGIDDREFVELYNPTSQAVSLNGWWLQGLDQAWSGIWPPSAGAQADNNFDFMLTGSIPAGGYFVAGAPTVANVTQVLTDPISGTSTDLWENGDFGFGGESIVLRDSQGNIVDSFSYEMAKSLEIGPLASSYPLFALGGVEGTGYWGNFASIDALIGSAIDGQGEQSLGRYADGVDTDDNGFDFGQMPQTPGGPNFISVTQLPYSDNFNLPMPETPVLNNVSGQPVWNTSFVGARIIDPTATGTNPNIIPASPVSGGNAMIMWDSGGDSGTLISTPQADWQLDFWMYLEAGAYQTPAAEVNYETTSIGVRGSTCAYANHPDINGRPIDPLTLLPYVSASANTGVAWVYRREESYGVLFPSGLYHSLNLIDFGNAGNDPVVLASYPVTAGVNDGWQHLKLEVIGDLVTAEFGAAKVHGTTQSTGCGGVYIGYRETIVTNSEARPVTIDDLSIITPTTTPLGWFLSQPAGPGSLFIAHRGMTPGLITFTAITVNEACPGGPGTGPLLGVCTVDLLGLVNLLNTATFYPFNFIPSGSTLQLGPLINTGLPAGLGFEGVVIQLLPTGGFANSGVCSLTLQ